jgi:hypothetical protein
VDEDVLKLISLATEIFINDLTNRAVYFTEYEKRKIMIVNMFKKHYKVINYYKINLNYKLKLFYNKFIIINFIYSN